MCLSQSLRPIKWPITVSSSSNVLIPRHVDLHIETQLICAIDLSGDQLLDILNDRFEDLCNVRTLTTVSLSICDHSSDRPVYKHHSLFDSFGYVIADVRHHHKVLSQVIFIVRSTP